MSSLFRWIHGRYSSMWIWFGPAEHPPNTDISHAKTKSSEEDGEEVIQATQTISLPLHKNLPLSGGFLFRVRLQAERADANADSERREEFHRTPL